MPTTDNDSRSSSNSLESGSSTTSTDFILINLHNNGDQELDIDIGKENFWYKGQNTNEDTTTKIAAATKYDNNDVYY